MTRTNAGVGGIGQPMTTAAATVSGDGIGAQVGHELSDRLGLDLMERGGYDRDGKAAGDAMRSILADADRLSGSHQS